ncbi:hypothetical protein H9P43_002561 [Blastocladiella emersonii ATCC 22665]|nr:hypothetical protein H9P43_002561 [Blastocladiella emersonii ATCC 22665]
MNTDATELKSTPVGALYCQRNSFARSLATRIVSVEVPAAAPAPAAGGKKKTTATPAPSAVETRLVVLEDTVMFPEGGGQPADRGTLTVGGTEFKVVDVQRKGTTAIHTVALPSKEAGELLVPGAEAETTLAWARRLDNMQQHSGQHLLSAVAEQEFGWRTASWSFGSEWNFIEVAQDMPDVPAQPITAATLSALESRVADHIAAAHPISVSETSTTTQTRGSSKALPADLRGATDLIVRTVVMGDVDANRCCGTHLTSTLQMQAVAVQPTTERVRGTNTRIYFAFGDRVRKLLAASLARDAALTAILSSGAPEFEEKVGKLVEASRADKRKLKATTDALAMAFVQLHLGSTPADASEVRRYHAEDATSMDLLLAMSTALKMREPEMTAVTILSAIDEAGAGAVLVLGPVGPALTEAIASVTAAFPTARGGGGKGKPGAVSMWQGRIAGKAEAAKLAEFRV